MKGKDLKKIVDDSPLSIDEIVQGSGIAKRTLYRLFDQEDIRGHYIDNLGKVLKLPKVAIIEPTTPSPDNIMLALKLLEKTIAMVESDNSLMKEIIQTGLDEGAIHFDTKRKIKQ